jgi:uncharacterized protein YoxC
MDRDKLLIERASRLILKEAEDDFDLDDLGNDETPDEESDEALDDDLEGGLDGLDDIEEESVEIDVTELVNSVDAVNRTLMDIIQSIDDLTESYLNNFVDIKNTIHQSSEQTTQMIAQQSDEIRNEFKKRIPTREERAEKFMPNITTSNQINTSEPSNDQSTYVLRKDDIENFSDDEIRRSL